MTGKDPACPYCGSEDVDWSRKDQKYGCYVCGKMFDGKPMFVKEGVYVGAGCSIIVAKGKTLNEITVVVSKEQLEWLKEWKNYDFHFDLEGEFSGSGTATTTLGQNKGEIIDRKKG